MIHEIICACGKRVDITKIEKAYGGCRKCYGKGYSTVKRQAQTGIEARTPKKWELDPIIPCDCDRGKQIEEILIKGNK